MEFHEYREAVKQIPVGKQLPDAVYLHDSALDVLPKALGAHLARALFDLNLADEEWNILKFSKRDHKVTLLNYPEFFDYAYPALRQSFTIDLEKGQFRKANYEDSFNPPILHRKETFLKPDHAETSTFKAITQEGEAIGLYEKATRIGFKQNWERLIKSKGYYLDKKGRLKPLKDKPGTAANTSDFNGDVERHRTAIDRNQLSQPMQALARHNYLNGDFSLLDYGCGKGDDVRELEAHGIDVVGWDPVHRPNQDYSSRDLVNLGFVLNVIEDRKERTDTLIDAWRHADKALIVSVMIAGDSVISQFQPYKDGVITSRNTFQKYYSQGEIRHYIESTLDESAIALGQGIFLIFKDKIEEQIFLSERQHIKRDWKQKTQRQLSLTPKAVKQDTIDKHIELFTDYWETTLELGRIPAKDEFEFSDQIRRLCGSHNKAHHALLKHFGEEVFKEAKIKRQEDLIVYFALGLFERRKPQTKLPERLKRDIKAFFDSYQQALEIATEKLFSVGKPEVIQQACERAYEIIGCGNMELGHSFTFHQSFIGDLPAELRIYIGCATQLYGDIENFQLVKAHITSGKVSLMRHDDWHKEEPLLVERVKIRLRDLDIDFFDYAGEFIPPPLKNKNDFI